MLCRQPDACATSVAIWLLPCQQKCRLYCRSGCHQQPRISWSGCCVTLTTDLGLMAQSTSKYASSPLKCPPGVMHCAFAGKKNVEQRAASMSETLSPLNNKRALRLVDTAVISPCTEALSDQSPCCCMITCTLLCIVLELAGGICFHPDDFVPF